MRPMIACFVLSAGMLLVIAVGPTRLQAQQPKVTIDQASPADTVESSSAIDWVQDFETVPPGIGSLPAGWVDGGGNDDFGVVATVDSCQGTRSLWLHGVLGGNWAAVVASPIVPSLAYVSDFTLELQVRNGSEHLWGYHPNRALLSMRNGSHWVSDGRGLFAVREDGRLDGPLGPMGPYLQLDRCYAIRIRYTRLDAQTVRLQYWLDGSPLADLTVPAQVYEDDLVWFMWVSDEGSAWFDDIALDVTPTCTVEWQETKLTASDAAAGDWLGHPVSVSGDRIVVGAPWDDDAGGNSGSAYVFRSEGIHWLQEAKLMADDAAAGDQFGDSVAIWGDYIVVGAVWDDDAGSDAGAAYVFARDDQGTPGDPRDDAWVPQAKLIGSDTNAGDWFGHGVSSYGDFVCDDRRYADWIVVGTRGEGAGPRAVYVFQRNDHGTPCHPSDDIWEQQAEITGIPLGFGRYVSVNKDRLVVGAPYDHHAGTNSGSAYVFRRDGANWVQEAKLIANDTAAIDVFGCSVSLSGEYAVIGAAGNNDVGDDSGSAYVFRRQGTTWVQQAKLTAQDAAQGDYFGGSVAINGSYAAIGAVDDDAGGIDSGSVYVFRREDHGTPLEPNDDTWMQWAKLTADDATGGERLGWYVGLDGGRVVAGAPYDDHAGAQSGSAYVFDVGGPDCNSNGVPDVCDIVGGTSAECNANSVPDECDIAEGTSKDCNENGIPDECELISDDCPYQVGDVNNDGAVNREDVLQFTLVLLGRDHCGCSVAAADINGDGAVDRRDARPFRRLLRCKLGYALGGADRGDSIAALTSLADQLGVELDLRTLLQEERDRDGTPVP